MNPNLETPLAQLTPALMKRLPTSVQIIEVGPRDGLQNERQSIPTDVKVEFIERLQSAGLKHIEATSFVSPKWVPQMADAREVLTRIHRSPGVTYAALVPNLKGLESAQEAGVDEIVIFTAASETFCQKNINCSIAESFERFQPVVLRALEWGLRIRGSISCSVVCPYEGAIAPAQVKDVAGRYADLGVHTISIADTIGAGTPLAIQYALNAAMAHYAPDAIRGHYHNTYGQALSNVYASLLMGISTFESSTSGLGGCPYAVGATGNLSTEDLLYMLQGLGIQTHVDLPAVISAGEYIREQLAQPTQSAVAKAFHR